MIQKTIHYQVSNGQRLWLKKLCLIVFWLPSKLLWCRSPHPNQNSHRYWLLVQNLNRCSENWRAYVWDRDRHKSTVVFVRINSYIFLHLLVYCQNLVAKIKTNSYHVEEYAFWNVIAIFKLIKISHLCSNENFISSKFSRIQPPFQYVSYRFLCIIVEGSVCINKIWLSLRWNAIFISKI